MDVTPELRNPAGTLQGAMVALVAEAAAEELASARFDLPAVVTDLDLRYLAQTGAGPVQTRCCLLGDGPDAPIQVELFDRSSDRLTTLVYARTDRPSYVARRGRQNPGASPTHTRQVLRRHHDVHGDAVLRRNGAGSRLCAGAFLVEVSGHGGTSRLGGHEDSSQEQTLAASSI